MPVYVLTYDLRRPGQDYKGVYAVRDRYDNVQVSESTYAIATNESASTVYQQFAPHIDGTDRLYVIPLGTPYTGFGPGHRQRLAEAAPRVVIPL